MIQSANEIAVVGDRLGTDVLMAGMMGSWSVWCKEGVFEDGEEGKGRGIFWRRWRFGLRNIFGRGRGVWRRCRGVGRSEGSEGQGRVIEYEGSWGGNECTLKRYLHHGGLISPCRI